MWSLVALNLARDWLHSVSWSCYHVEQMSERDCMCKALKASVSFPQIIPKPLRHISCILVWTNTPYCNWRVLIGVGVFIKFTDQTLNAQLSERFTNHQRVHCQMKKWNESVYFVGASHTCYLNLTFVFNILLIKVMLICRDLYQFTLQW